MFCAGAALSRALAYRPGINEPLPPGLAEVADLISTGVYGVLWGVTAIALCRVAVKRRKVIAWDALLVGCPALWGIFYLIGGLAQDNEKALTAAYLFWCMGGIFATFLMVAPKTNRQCRGE